MSQITSLKNLNLESKSLITKKLQEQDAPTLFKFYSDEQSMKFRGSTPMVSISEADDMILNQVVINPKVSKFRTGIWTKSPSELIGTLLLKIEANTPSEIEIGFSFGKAHRNKGYGTEVLSMILNHFQQITEFGYIKAWCIKENHASVKLFNKAGFNQIPQTIYPLSYLFKKSLDD